MSPRQADTPVQHWVAPAYYVAVLLILTGAFDFVTNVWPLTPSDIRWRFGAVGLLAGFLITPILGAIIGLATATIAGHRRAVRIIGILLCVASALLVAMLGVFALDAVQLHAMMPNADSQASFVVAVVKALSKHISGLIGLIWLGVAGLRAARDMPAAVMPPASKKRGSLLVTEG